MCVYGFGFVCSSVRGVCVCVCVRVCSTYTCVYMYRAVAIRAAEAAMVAPVFAESAMLYFLAVHEHVAKIIRVCRLTVTCYLNRSEFVAFGPLLFRQCVHAFWSGKLALWPMATQKKPGTCVLLR